MRARRKRRRAARACARRARAHAAGARARAPCASVPAARAQPNEDGEGRKEHSSAEGATRAVQTSGRPCSTKFWPSSSKFWPAPSPNRPRHQATCVSDHRSNPRRSPTSEVPKGPSSARRFHKSVACPAVAHGALPSEAIIALPRHRDPCMACCIGRHRPPRSGKHRPSWRRSWPGPGSPWPSSAQPGHRPRFCRVFPGQRLGRSRANSGVEIAPALVDLAQIPKTCKWSAEPWHLAMCELVIQSNSRSQGARKF